MRKYTEGCLHPFAGFAKEWDLCCMSRKSQLTTQMSGHDFSALPGATKGSKGCVVVPKRFRQSSFLAPQARAQRQRSDLGFQFWQSFGSVSSVVSFALLLIRAHPRLSAVKRFSSPRLRASAVKSFSLPFKD